ncbi:MAG: hypothetical protein BWZ10_03488 [candidate division BRC1 bacterium ADurb.BinA364]|nr:MAG: hypothetical protein BWZ10_03488 [candidate division BRC1 bacterium ADurb.BinA364]
MAFLRSFSHERAIEGCHCRRCGLRRQGRGSDSPPRSQGPNRHDRPRRVYLLRRMRPALFYRRQGQGIRRFDQDVLRLQARQRVFRQDPPHRHAHAHAGGSDRSATQNPAGARPGHRRRTPIPVRQAGAGDGRFGGQAPYSRRGPAGRSSFKIHGRRRGRRRGGRRQAQRLGCRHRRRIHRHRGRRGPGRAPLERRVA